jgi:hypothetical protein
MGLFTEREDNTIDATTSYKFGIISIILIGFIGIWFSITHDKENVTKAEESYLSLLQKQDSLKSVINNLEAELEFQEKGFDKKEQRYEDILFEYEYGIERLRETHPEAYKEFHRIIAYKERYSVEDRNDNQKRLKYE